MNKSIEIMPGFDKTRFVDLIESESEEFTCGICLGIFCDPIETKCCRKTYCFDCINDWILDNNSCPNDRNLLSNNDLIRPSKITINLLSKLRIRCDYQSMGCEEVIGLDSILSHCERCPYNECLECGLKLGKIEEHNCVQLLKEKIQINDVFKLQEIEIKDKQISRLKSQNLELRQENEALREELFTTNNNTFGNHLF